MLKYVKMLKDISDKFNIKASSQVVLPNNIWNTLVSGINTNLIEVTGNLNITDSGVASGFSAENYITIINGFTNLVLNSEIKWIFTFTTPSLITSSPESVVTSTIGIEKNIAIKFNNNGFFGYADVREYFLSDILPNTTYSIRISFPTTASIKYEQYVTDQWIELRTISNNNLEVAPSAHIGIGETVLNEQYFSGSIDLVHSGVCLTSNDFIPFYIMSV